MAYVKTSSQRNTLNDDSAGDYGSIKRTDNKADISSMTTPRRALEDVKNVASGAFKTPSTFKKPYGVLGSVVRRPVPFNISEDLLKSNQGTSLQQLSSSDRQFYMIDPDAPAETFNYRETSERFEELVPDPERRIEIDHLFFNIISNRSFVRQLFTDIVSDEQFEEIERDALLPEEEFLKKISDLTSNVSVKVTTAESD
ncbi:unnamed protein product [Enterobius vermicularis]|uniref:RPAP1_N domain-containing protein n=1 Tax=Enterobius vermicularis TaxID=51028 RepID=A0A0N4V522_ENTVE|nr:unnamed protein product [Enterobius vermicularis]